MKSRVNKIAAPILAILAVSGFLTVLGGHSNRAANMPQGLSSLSDVSSSPFGSTSGFSGYVKSTFILNNGTVVPGNIDPYYDHRIAVPIASAFDPIDNRVYVTNGRSFQTARSDDLVTVIDAATNKVVTSIPVVDPRGLTHNPANDYLYVTSGPGVTVLSGATNRVVENLTLGTSGGTSGVAYDPANKYLYVAGYSSSSVAIIDTSTNNLIANVTVGGFPTGLAYDSRKNEMYVNCLESGIVSIISGPNNQVVNVTVIPHPSPPPTFRVVQPPYQDIVFDPLNNNLYMVDYFATGQTDKVFVISDLSNTLANFTISSGLGAISYDSSNDKIYVTSGLSPSDVTGNTVTEVDPATDKPLANVTVGFGPVGMAYDPNNRDLYVANSHGYSVSIIDDRTNSVVATDFVQTYPSSVAYDSRNGMLYVANEGSYDATLFKDSLTTNIFLLNPANNAITPISIGGIGPMDLLYDPDNNYLYISSVEPGIMILDTTSNRLVANITLPNAFFIAGLAFDPQDHRIYVANNGYRTSDSIVYAIDDRTNSVVATIPTGLGPLGLAYDASNNDIYVSQYSLVASRSTNSVTVIGGSTNTLVANVTVGSRPAGILYDPASGAIYVADSGSNELSVISDRSNSVVATIPVKMDPFASPYGLIYDQFNNEVFATNQFPEGGQPPSSNIVSVIDGRSNTFLGNLTLGYSPSSGAYDLGNGYLYVTNYLSGTLSIITSRSTFPSITTVSCGQDLVCSVASNSTLSGIRFAGNTIHVEAQGPSGAEGYANVTVPRSVVPRIDNVHVLVDNSKLNPSSVIISSNSTDYFVYFTFVFHSPVVIDVQLVGPNPSPSAPSPTTIFGLDPTLFYGIVAATAVTLLVVTIVGYRFSRDRSKFSG